MAKRKQTPKKLKEIKARRVARLIAVELFTAGDGEVATSLKLVKESVSGNKDLGGWGICCMQSHIEAIIKREQEG